MTVQALSLADRIRAHVVTELIEPARAAGRTTVTVRAGDIHAALDLENRMPAVCGALDAHKFYAESGVALTQRPGRSSAPTAEWVWRCEEACYCFSGKRSTVGMQRKWPCI